MLNHGSRYLWGWNILEGIRILCEIPIHLFILLFGIPMFDVNSSELEQEKEVLIHGRIEAELKGRNRNKYIDVKFMNHLISHKQLYLEAKLPFDEEK